MSYKSIIAMHSFLEGNNITKIEFLSVTTTGEEYIGVLVIQPKTERI